jgi:hypothetical protein
MGGAVIVDVGVGVIFVGTNILNRVVALCRLLEVLGLFPNQSPELGALARARDRR